MIKPMESVKREGLLPVSFAFIALPFVQQTDLIIIIIKKKEGNWITILLFLLSLSRSAGLGGVGNSKRKMTCTEKKEASTLNAKQKRKKGGKFE